LARVLSEFHSHLLIFGEIHQASRFGFVTIGALLTNNYTSSVSTQVMWIVPVSLYYPILAEDSIVSISILIVVIGRERKGLKATRPLWALNRDVASFVGVDFRSSSCVSL
jgi:hypothetical protein